MKLWIHVALGLCVALTVRGVEVEAKKKPVDKWIPYSTRTLEQLPNVGLDAGLDQYGGLVAGQVPATGFFQVRQIDGRWWLIDPDGRRFIHVGIASVAPGQSKNSRAALQEKFGSTAAWTAQTVELLKTNAFNGTGAWSDVAQLRAAPKKVAYTMIWNFMSSYGKKRGGTYQQAGHAGYPNDCIFVFDPEFATFCDEFAKQLTATKDDPWLLGHFSDNELPFMPDALDRYLALPESDAGHKAAHAWLAARHAGKITETDRQEFLGIVADQYYRLTTQAIRKSDPNHLCLGSRLHGGDLNQRVLSAAAGKYLDVVSVNYYNAWTPDRERMKSWALAAGKPFMVTEFYVKGMDAGLANTTGAGWCVKTQRDRGLFYQNFTLGLLESRNCVGWHWFKYQDNDPEDLTTDPSNRNSNKGVISCRFDPYPPLLDAMRQLNQRVYRLVDFFDHHAASQ